MLRARIKIDRPAFKGGGGNPAAFPQKKRCNLKKRTPPIHTRAFPGPYRHCKDGTAGDAVGRADCKLPVAGYVRIFCGGVLIFGSERLRFFFICRNIPGTPRLSHSRPGAAGHLEDFL